MKSLIFLSLFLVSATGICQVQCPATFNPFEFNANKIYTSFHPHGMKFYGPDDLYFTVPFPNQTKVYTLFSGSPWVGSMTRDTLYLAGQQYGFHRSEYFPGPLDTTVSFYPALCYRFDTVWNVFLDDILHHQQDYQADGFIDDPIPSIYGWPAEGNLFFSAYNGFDLPDDHAGGWADFKDLNFNGRYDPDQGEYPIAILGTRELEPDQLMWMVYNDQGPHLNAFGRPVGVEIQFTAFAFYCQDNPVLNYSLFNTYKVINQNRYQLDSVFFGVWHDYDLGCSEDDFLGCDTIRQSEFSYNEDSTDGDVQDQCSAGIDTYGNNPPVQSMTLLSHPLHAFNFVDSRVQNDTAFYHLLNGRWDDGTPITPYLDGYNPDSTQSGIRYLFPGDPLDPDAWSQLKSSGINIHPSTVSSISLRSLEPKEMERIETVYMFHQDSTLDHLQTISLMRDQIDSMRSYLAAGSLPCTPYPVCEHPESCVWPGDMNHDGIANQYDLLHWSFMLDQAGVVRNGLINWKGHLADDWSSTTPGGLNLKHGDASGDGQIDPLDLDVNTFHFGKTTPFYMPRDTYPEGDDLAIGVGSVDTDGRIKSVWITTARDIDNLYALAFELEYDTTFYTHQLGINRPMADEQGIIFFDDQYTDAKVTGGQFHFEYAHAYTDHKDRIVTNNTTLIRIVFGILPKAGYSFEDLPDSLVLRIKNLVGYDSHGNDLHLGCNPVVVYKDMATSQQPIDQTELHLYPNPADDRLWIESASRVVLSVVNQVGQLVMTAEIEPGSNSIDVSDLTPGMYILRAGDMGSHWKVVIH